MKKNIFSHILFFIVVILLFYLYESSEMTSITLSKLNKDTDSVTYKYRVMLFVFCGSYCLFNKKIELPFLRKLFMFIFIIWVISVLHYQDNIISTLIFSTNMLLPLVAFIYFYHVSHTISSKVFYIGNFLGVVILLHFFINTYQLMLLESLTDEVKAGSSYIFLFLLPFFLVSKNQVIKWSGVIFVATLMVFSMKRGGLLSFSLALVVFYYVSLICEDRKIKFKSFLWMLCILSIIFYVVSVGLESYFIDMVSRFTSIKDDGGSARDRVYEVTWRMITESDRLSLCIGHGWNMVVEKSPMGLSAHNDFMEVIYDFGIFAFFIYVYFYFVIYKTMFRLIKQHSEYAAPFAFSVITFTINSTIAHVLIYPFNFIAVTAVWGYILGKEKLSNQPFQIAKR